MRLVLKEQGRKFVGDRPRTGGASLGWNNLEVWGSVEPKDTIHVEIGTPKSRASNSRPGMVITTIRKAVVNQKGEKILAVDHILGFW